MKGNKFLTLLLVFVLTCSILCACGSSEPQEVVATIELTDGTIKEFYSIESISQEYYKNEVANGELYQYAKTTVIGNIENIEDTSTTNSTLGITLNDTSAKITLEGGLTISMSGQTYADNEEVLKSIAVGDKLKATGELVEVGETFIDLSVAGYGIEKYVK